MASLKRTRDDGADDQESSGSSAPEAAGDISPTAKRFHAADIIEILEDDNNEDNNDDADSGDRSSLADVMRSLEDELRPSVPELGFLLEASDDELGLPPATDDHVAGDHLAAGDLAGNFAGGEVSPAPAPEKMTFGGDNWGFDDENITGCYDDMMGFGVRYGDGGVTTDMGDDEFVVFDGGLFDYGPSDFEWRAEWLPAV